MPRGNVTQDSLNEGVTYFEDVGIIRGDGLLSCLNRCVVRLQRGPSATSALHVERILILRQATTTLVAAGNGDDVRDYKYSM